MEKFFEMFRAILYKLFMALWIGWAISTIPYLVQEVNKLRDQPFNGSIFGYWFVIGLLCVALAYEVADMVKWWKGPDKTKIRVFFNGEEVDADIKTEKD